MTYYKSAIAVALMLVASSAHAQVTNLVTNGSFEEVTNGWVIPNNPFNLPGNIRLLPSDADSGVTGWTNKNKVAFNVNPESIPKFLWTTENGGSKLVTPSPDGGRFIMMDADINYRGLFSQAVSGLTPGDSYQLSFYSALGQQFGPNYAAYGATSDILKVSLGSQTQYAWGSPGKPTPVPAHGFTGWQSINLSFQATAATETLSFLAMGGPSGEPPMILLDGVSLTAAVPEPEEWAMMLVGAGLVSWQVRRKQAKVVA